MPMLKRLISAVEAAEQIMNEWGDNASNAVEIVILPPSNLDMLTDDKQVQDDDVMIDKGLPSDAYCMAHVQIKFFQWGRQRW